MNIIEGVDLESQIDENYPPSYDKPGRILVHLLGPCVTGVYRHESEVLDYDSDSSIFWIQEGVGFDYWFDSYCDFPEYLDEGFFVIEGITGEYIRGEGGWDDDEEWSHTGIRQATDEEIQGCGLGDKI